MRRARRVRRWAVPAGVLLALVGVGPAPAAAVDVPGPRRPPTAATGIAMVDAFDCAKQEVRLRLDNTGSTQAARFGYEASYVRPLRAPYAGADGRLEVLVASGSTRLVVLPLRNDARTAVTVHLPGGRDAKWQSSCGNAPGAIFGPSDCGALRLGVLLDNRTSPVPTRFRWALDDPAGLVATEAVDVRAGGVSSVEVPIVDNSWTAVAVSVDGRGTVARLNRQACGWIVLDPRAAFGVVDCRDVSVPVLLDNARSSSRLRFHLPGDDVVLGPGETRSLRLHLPIRELLAVTVDEVLPLGRSVVRAVTSTAHCATVPAVAGPSVSADPASGPRASALAGGGRAAPVVAARGGDATAAGSAPASTTVVGGWVLVVLVALGLLVVALRRRRATSS